VKLSEFELDVMEIYWKHSSMCAVDVHREIKEIRDVSYSTVKTIIDRLEQKSALTRAEKQGRTIFYTAAIEPSQVSKPMIKGFLRRLFSGKPQQLIAQLIQDEELTNDDIATLEKMLASKKNSDSK